MFAATAILIFFFIVAKSKVKLGPALLVEIATFSALLVPFVLPKMHQRYFFPADVLSIAFGFYFPAYFYVPLIINLVSFFSYQYFLFGPETFPMSLLAFATLIILAILTRKLILDLYPGIIDGQEKNEFSLAESD